MIWVIRLKVLIVEVIGLYFALKLAHEGNLWGAFTRVAFDVGVILLFVSLHVLVEQILCKLNVKERRAWRGRTWWL
jgi:hypothetical protein